MNNEDVLQTALSFHRAWTTTHDLEAAEQLLSADLETDLPVNTYANKQEFVEAIRGFGGIVSRSTLLSQCASGDEAVLIYDLEMAPLGVLRIAELNRVVDGQITFIRHVHDTATMRAAGFAPPLAAAS